MYFFLKPVAVTVPFGAQKHADEIFFNIPVPSARPTNGTLLV
jgi:hypothetical protein